MSDARPADRVEVGGERLLPPLASISSRCSTGSTRIPAPIQPETPAQRGAHLRRVGAARPLGLARRRSTWGIPFPGHPGQTVYVWLDALTNYITALGFGAPEGEGGRVRDVTGSDGDVRLQLIGKDIIRFHAVYWPAFLMSAGLPLPTTVWAHGWWLRDEKKMSKSVGNVVRPDDLVERFGADGAALLPAARDGLRPGRELLGRGVRRPLQRDLANDLGNTVSRIVTLSRQAFDGRTPPVPCDDNPLIADGRAAVVADYRAAMDELAFQDAPARRSGGCSPRRTSTSSPASRGS